MLHRKQSVRVNDGIIQIPLVDFSTQNATQNTADDTINDSIALDWINKKWIQRAIRVFAFLSFMSICANTPATIKISPFVLHVILSIDIISSVLFSAEMITKISIKSLYKNENSYMFDRWCQFDFMMVLFHWVSVLLQVFELLSKKSVGSYWSILRCPRPLILIRVIRGFLKFRLPKNRINSILQRSSSQIYNVTIFFLFFMALYGILGVQFFGKLTSHCVKNDTDPNNVYLNNLMIPDTYCTTQGPSYGYQCPEGMKCIELVNIKREDRGFNGFDEIVTSIFTVYEAASQEGWVFLMYRATDSLPSWRAFFYFISMIFFLAWLVKNVFIAVIIETFAEIRVQFQQMWGARDREEELEQAEVFERKENGILRLVTRDENKAQGIAPSICLKILRSSWFNMTIMLLVLANAIITAMIKHLHNEKIDKETMNRYYYIEAIFTLLFDLEVLYKIFCLGFKTYIRRSMYKFEFTLAIGTSLRLIPYFYRTEFTYFQVLRVVRLIKSSPLLEDFVQKIFGPGKKLGSLIIFTMCLLIITSCVSMQLFCFLSSDKYKKFERFDQAFMSQFSIITNEGWTELMFETMKEAVDDFYLFTYFIPIYFIFCHMFCSLAFMTMFQILTQKGWLDIMHMTMRQASRLSPLVAIYFISYHLFVTLIVLSLFVAVILDNLELEEDVKKIKQLKMREQSAEIQEKLPWRLRIFENFPNQPQMISLRKVANDFDVPKIRESFMRQFLNDDYYKGFENFLGITNSTNQNKKLSMDSITKSDVPSIKQSTRISFKHSKAHHQQQLSQDLKANNLEKIVETASTNSLFSKDTAIIDNYDGPTNTNSLLRRRRILSPSTHAEAHMRAFNQFTINRVCRQSMKKIILNDIIKNSNNQRLLLTESINQPYIIGFNDTKLMQNIANAQKINSVNRMENFKVKSGLSRSTPLMNGNASIGGLSKTSSNPRFQQMSLGNIGATSATGTDIDFKMYHFKKQEAELKRNQLEDDLKENHPYFDKPLFLIGRDSSLRKFCKMIVEARYRKNLTKQQTNQTSTIFIKNEYKTFHKFIGLVTYIDWIMIFVTITSCISIAFEEPTKRIVENWQLQVAEYLFVICMSIEIGLKVCAHGFMFTPNALIKDFAGILDIFIYLISLIFLLMMPQQVPANSGAQILMLLRCLRPLRIFTLVPHMRKVIYELCRGFKEILLVSVLLVVLIFIFANYGIQIYGGRLARCNDISIKRKEDCVGLYRRNLFVTKLRLQSQQNRPTPSIWVPRIWSNPYNFDFDSISQSMLALFEVLSLEGWLEVRDVIIERMGARHAIFVHVFVFIGTLIGLTLFVGVVITNYSENKGTALLTVDQRRWLDLKGRIKLAQPLHIPPRPEKSPFRGFMFDITQHKFFKRFSAILVLLNCGLLSVPWNPEDYETKVLAAISVTFTLLFLIEALMKMFALGPFGYWQSRRNRFDLFVTFLGLLWILTHFISLGKKDLQSSSNTFGFVVIVLRFFTITGKHATLKMLMLTIIVSFFKSFFIILGMFLLMVVYAFAGVILFGCVKSGHDLGRHANFKSAPNAIILLMRIVTGEDWNKIMHDCMIAPPACTKASNYWESDCGNFPAALLYFCSFYIIITYIVLNLLVAIIMENFSLFYSNEEDALLSYSDIRHFQIVWNMVDINRKGVIPCKRVKFLLRLLRGRLEVDLERDRLLFKHMCYEIEKLNNGGDVTFHDVLNMLSYRSVDIRKSLKLEELLVREELEYQIEEEVAKITIRNWLNKCLKRIREKDHSNLIKSLQKQNDIAIFKEQYINRQHLLAQPILLLTPQTQPNTNILQPASSSSNLVQQQKQEQKQEQQQQQSQQNNFQQSQNVPSNVSMSSSNLNSPSNVQTTNMSHSISATISDTNVNQKWTERKRSSIQNNPPSINSISADNAANSFKQSVTDLSASKIDRTKSIKQKERNNQFDEMDEFSSRHLKMLQESQMMSNDLKSWWEEIINNEELDDDVDYM